MNLTRKWAWEHTWAVFCLLAMIVFNWGLASALLPSPAAFYALVPRRELMDLAGFGLAWGVSAVLFGLAMDRLGLALGYPIIMGLTASVGALLPMLTLAHGHLGLGSLVVMAGVLLGVAGIVSCSMAGAGNRPASRPRSQFTFGLIIAIVSGFLSCLPNIGLAYGTGTIHSARLMGASEALAGNAVWCIFFTLGGIVNVVYCVWLMAERRSFRTLIAPGSVRDLGCGAAMALLWIGSFYLYGIGVARIGVWGTVVGWPVFICLAIGVGALGGWLKGEWREAPRSAVGVLRQGLVLILLAVVVLALGNLI
jgi:L-rhamnose-H+ transport protein